MRGTLAPRDRGHTYLGGKRPGAFLQSPVLTRQKGVTLRSRRLAIWGTVALLIALVVAVQASADTGPTPAAAARAQHGTPAPPRLPANFRARGRWVVRSLGITVPFTWRGENGNSRMVAGGKHYPIWFVNLIYHNRLYTLDL